MDQINIVENNKNSDQHNRTEEDPRPVKFGPPRPIIAIEGSFNTQNQNQDQPSKDTEAAQPLNQEIAEQKTAAENYDTDLLYMKGLEWTEIYEHSGAEIHCWAG